MNRYLKSLHLPLTTLLFLFSTNPVLAQAGIGNVYNPATKFTPQNTSLATILTGGGFNLFNLIFFFVGLAFFANIVLASITFITAEGDPAKVSKANTRITNSVLGLALTFAAFIIVSLVAYLFGFQALLPFTQR